MCLYWKPQQVMSTALSILPLSILRHWRGHMKRSCRQQTEPEAWAPLEMTNMHKVVQPSPQHCSYGVFCTLQFPLAYFIPASLLLRAVHPQSPPFKGHLVSPKHSAACQSSASGIQVIRWRFIVNPQWIRKEEKNPSTFVHTETRGLPSSRPETWGNASLAQPFCWCSSCWCKEVGIWKGRRRKEKMKTPKRKEELWSRVQGLPISSSLCL